METNTVTQTLPDKATKVVGDARAWADGWSRAADFMEANPEIVEEASASDHGSYVLHYISDQAEPIPFLADAAEKAVAAGAVVRPYQSSGFGGINIVFGPVRIQIYTEIGKVYARQVVGTVEQVEYAPLFSIPSQDGEEK